MNRQRLWTLVRRHWFDAVLVALIGLGLATVVVTVDEKDGPLGPLWFDVLAVLAVISPLFARRRFPFGAPATCGIAAAAVSFVDGEFTPNGFFVTLAAIAAFVLFGLLRDRTQALAGLALGTGVTAIVERNDPNGTVGDFLAASFLFTIAWAIGFALGHKFREADEVKERLARAERERVERARFAVAEERTRIARELHDVVGHSVSVMTVQASAARRLLRPHQVQEREALLVVEQTGREALAEMRRMVGVLRRPEDAPALAPQPSLEHLDRLIAHTSEAGLAVDLRIEGEPEPLAASIDLTAYRLVQEGLANSLRHGRARHAEVVVRYGGGQVELIVTDDGEGENGSTGDDWLAAMRERVSIYGGEIQAGPLREGGYRLRARLPLS